MRLYGGVASPEGGLQEGSDPPQSAEVLDGVEAEEETSPLPHHPYRDVNVTPSRNHLPTTENGWVGGTT